MRKKIVAGNWKMNKELMDALQLATAVVRYAQQLPEGVEAIIAPPAVYLHVLNAMRKDTPQLKIAAQNCSSFEGGAYTGELSASILKSINTDYVILGHSERRKYFQESNDLLKEKVDQLLTKDLDIIFCCGEPLEIREAGTHEAHIAKQLKDSLFHLSADDFKSVIIAYEPVWAIGTGKTATPQQAQSMHKFIRKIVSEQYGELVAGELVILYGGSCKPANAEAIFSQNDVDGGLIGGASLVDNQFITLLEQLQNN